MAGCAGRSLLTLLAALLLAAAYMLGPMRAYAYLPIVFVSNLPWWQDAALVLVAGLAIGALGVGSRSAALSHIVKSHAPTLVAAVVCAAAVYALYLRQPGGKLTDYDAFALRTFAYLLPDAYRQSWRRCSGMRWSARQRFWRDPALFVTVAIFAVFLLLQNPHCSRAFLDGSPVRPSHPAGDACSSRAARRWPECVGKRGRTRLLRGSLGFVFLALLGLHYARVANPLLDHVEYAGIIPKLEQLAATIRDDDLLIVESRDASDTARARPSAGLHLRPERPAAPIARA